MKEFGSDFHKCDSEFLGNKTNLSCVLGDLRYYANGRLTLNSLTRQEKWSRIWIPFYFCHEVIEYIKTLGIKVMYYNDNPLEENDDFIVRTLPYLPGDVLLRVNYFGLRTFRSNNGIKVPVIEDHTHDLISYWAVNSDADWCIASVRKTLPVPAGGILWSPTNKMLPSQQVPSDDCNEMASIRYLSMIMKSEYLEKGGDKSIYREKFMQTEKMLEELALSGIDNVSKQILDRIDIKKWTQHRVNNWLMIRNLLDSRFKLIAPTDNLLLNPFSAVILCKSSEERTAFRQYLINNNVYPAILWDVPQNTFDTAIGDFSSRMVSIHCDARYNNDDIKQLCRIINSFYD